MNIRKWLSVIAMFTICFMFTGCGHEHTWIEATCTEPKTCSECGETEGDSLGHTWVEATCSESKHCSVCGEIEGEPLEHTMTEANYQQTATSEECGATVGDEFTQESIQEPISYEGIDMKSTLPGKEWMDTFWDAGIFKEPVFVVYNDETNKKLIVENGANAEFDKGDILAIFNPGTVMLGVCFGDNIDHMNGFDRGYNEIVFTEGDIPLPNQISVDYFTNDGTEKLGEITCTLVPTE